MNNPTAGAPVRIALGTAAYRRISLALLMAGFATFALLYGTQPLLPQFAAQYAISAAESSLAVSFSTGAMALAFIPAAIVSDRFGRRPVMITSLFAASALTVLSAVLPGWHTLLVMRALTGLALAGIPGIAMAYVAEECDSIAIGSAMGLYIAGSAIGGMAGRLGITLVSQYFGWRAALGSLGTVALLSAVCFALAAPASRSFVAYRHNVTSFVTSTARLLSDAALPWLYLAGFLLMGAFVTVYNYVGFRLLAPPYSLSQAEVGSIFLLYIVGSISSAWVGGIAGRVGRRKVFWMPIAVMIVGVALTATSPLVLVILGIGVMTGAFFGAHSTASGWVGRRASQNRAQASSLYLLFYYLGSSIMGSVGGFAWTAAGWPGVATYAVALVVIGLGIAAKLSTVPPLPDPARIEPATAAVTGR
jgi:YNFM family putative membrane transporter